MIEDLILLATRLDQKGYVKEANYIDSIIKRSSWDLVAGAPEEFRKEMEAQAPIGSPKFSPKLTYVPRAEDGEMVATLSKKDAILLKRELERGGREGLSRAVYELSELQSGGADLDPRLESLIASLDAAHDALFDAYMNIDHIVSGTGS